MSLIQVIILAMVQGIAEFLPISSSGHLVVLAAWLSPTGSTADLDVSDVNIVLHAGTLLSIIVFYWYRILRLLREDRRVIPLLIVGSLPVGVIGVIIKINCEYVLEIPLLAGAMLIVTGVILWFADRLPEAEGRYQELSYRKAFLIGLAQALAILPGISRSGTTISSGMALGLSRTNAATFSFLLAIPAIGGASLFEIKKLVSSATHVTPLEYLAVGAVISFVVGLISLSILIRVLQRGRLVYFAYWCIPMGIGVIIWQLLRYVG